MARLCHLCVSVIVLLYVGNESVRVIEKTYCTELIRLIKVGPVQHCALQSTKCTVRLL